MTKCFKCLLVEVKLSSTHQLCFRPSDSCINQVLLITHDIRNSSDEKYVKDTLLLKRILSDRKQGVNWQCTIVPDEVQ